jgi:hypothetical protein
LQSAAPELNRSLLDTQGRAGLQRRFLKHLGFTNFISFSSSVGYLRMFSAAAPRLQGESIMRNDKIEKQHPKIKFFQIVLLQTS